MSDLKKGQDILANEVTSEPGVSDAGIDIRRADERNKGAISHGYGRVSDASFHKEKAKNHLKSLVNALKAQPKPNLTKDELEKGDVIDMFPKKTMERKVNTRAANKMKKDPLHQPETELKNLDEKGHWDKDKGISQAGSDVRHYRRNPDDQAHDKSYGGGAYQTHRRVLAGLKAQPKPNLTKADIESFDGKLQKDDHWGKKIQELKAKKDAVHQQKLETHFKAKGQAVPEHLKNPQSTNLDYKQMKQEFKAKKIIPTAAPVKTPAPTPAVSTAAPAEAKPERYGKLFDPSLSGTVSYKKSEKASVQPAQTSDPAIINNRISISSPVKISGPAQLDSFNGGKMKKSSDALKKMVGCLKKIDPKTKLPGIMMDKSQNMQKDMNISPQVPMVSKADKDIKGVHKPSPWYDKKTGISESGTSIRNNKGKMGKLPEMEHKEILQELKDMPKPKLDKAELEKFDSELAKSWGNKIEKASPAPAPAPAQPKPAMPKIQAPKTKMPKPQAPKQPEMQMSEHEKGVHQADYSTQYIKDGKTQHGISSAGIKARESANPSSFNEYENSPKVAKEIHKKVLSAIKNMKKPNLPK